MKTIVDRLPCGLREKWRETVDDIIQRKESDVNVEDITSFIEKRARVVTHPVYGNLGSDNRNIDSGKPKHKPATATQRGSSFAIQSQGCVRLGNLDLDFDRFPNRRRNPKTDFTFRISPPRNPFSGWISITKSKSGFFGFPFLSFDWEIRKRIC